VWVRIQISVWHSSSCLWHSHCTLLYTLIDSNYEIHLWAVINRATGETVSHWHLTTEVRVQYQSNPCEICGGQCGTGTSFSLSNSIFTSVPFYQSSILIYSCITDTVWPQQLTLPYMTYLKKKKTAVYSCIIYKGLLLFCPKVQGLNLFLEFWRPKRAHMWMYFSEIFMPYSNVLWSSSQVRDFIQILKWLHHTHLPYRSVTIFL